jgi:ribosome biogenesis GTPase A
MSTPEIQWYPGHIAKAERQLQEQLKKVDVVLEVRDARIPIATHHPQVANWIGSRLRVLVLNRVDQISPAAKQEWTEWFKEQGEEVLFANAQSGTGVTAIAKAAQFAGVAIDARRKQRGMLPRPVRAVVIGFPNVGKSALINRLLKRRVVESARKAGVTRQLRWIRIDDRLELLDAPGIIPIKLNDRNMAVKLAICDDIGEAAYDRQRIASAFVEMCQELGYVDALADRYGSAPTSLSGDEYLHTIAGQDRFLGDVERVANLILNDFRTGVLGPLSLELPSNECVI